MVGTNLAGITGLVSAKADSVGKEKKTIRPSKYDTIFYFLKATFKGNVLSV